VVASSEDVGIHRRLAFATVAGHDGGVENVGVWRSYVGAATATGLNLRLISPIDIGLALMQDLMTANRSADCIVTIQWLSYG